MATQAAKRGRLTADAGVYTSDTDCVYAIARRIRSSYFTWNGREGEPKGMQPYFEIETVLSLEKPNGL